MERRRTIARPGRPWVFVGHRYFGLTLAAFGVVLAVTGFMLNHTEALGLDSRYVRWSPLLDWYGISTPNSVAAFRVGERWVTQLGERLYLDERELAGQYGPLAGAIALPDALAIAAGQLLLLTPAGEPIERLGPAEGLPGEIHRIGLTAATEPVVETAQGRFVADPDFLEWREDRGHHVTWSVAAEPPAALHHRLVERYRGASLSWERLLLDLHSGRLFGRAGVWIVDLAALLLLLLAATGIWIWFKTTRQRRST